VDVRLVAATNKSLEKLVADGKFRDDLFYRLNVVQITIPPLRERKEDIPLLVSAFLKQFAKENAKPSREFTADANDALLSYAWPGNVRELRTAVEHGVVMATGAKIGLRDLPLSLRQIEPGAKWSPAGGTKPGTLQNPGSGNLSHLNLQETEHRLIMRALDESKGNRTEAAQRLGISRRTLHRRLKAIEETQS
jgi:DNA-binding NtrC family response regulator